MCGLARAETGQREAELQVLKAQIDSHFLFNALNTIWADLDRSQQVLKTSFRLWPTICGILSHIEMSIMCRLGKNSRW